MSSWLVIYKDQKVSSSIKHAVHICRGNFGTRWRLGGQHQTLATLTTGKKPSTHCKEG